MNGGKESFLLHCCCAPCFTHPVRILSDRFNVTAFFYNPNIQPEEECRAREEEMRRLAGRWRIDLVVGEYDVDRWHRLVEGMEDEPEGGARCEVCYGMRLEETARMARERGIGTFGSTLSISPHKNAKVINRVGRELGERYGVAFYNADFKKKDGFRISCRISEEEGLYRQDYCGCVYSRRGRHD